MAKRRNKVLDRLIVAAAVACEAKEGTRKVVTAESLLRGMAPHRWRDLDRPPTFPEITGRLAALVSAGLLHRLPDHRSFQVTDDGERAIVSFTRSQQEVS